jgi:hypothetical protein
MADQIVDYTVRMDAQGKPYWTTQSGQPRYLSPAQAAQSGNPQAVQWAASQGEVYTRDATGRITNIQTAAPRNTFAHQNNGWNPQTGQWDIGLNQGGLMGLIEGGAAVAGPAVIGPLLTGSPTVFAGLGGSAAAGNSAPLGGLAADGTLPSAVTPAMQQAAMNGSMIPATSAAPSLTAGVPTFGGSAAGGAGASFASKLLGGLTNNPGHLAGVITSLVGGSGGGTSATDQQRRIMAITEARMRRADPLHQMVVNLAASRMPTNMQLPVPQIPLPE